MLIIDESWNDRDAELSIGDTLRLELSENPTTGYRWRMPEVGLALRILEDPYEAPTGGPEAAASGAGPWRRTRPASCLCGSISRAAGSPTRRKPMLRSLAPRLILKRNIDWNRDALGPAQS
jgi:hypothetical protein